MLSLCLIAPEVCVISCSQYNLVLNSWQKQKMFMVILQLHIRASCFLLQIVCRFLWKCLFISTESASDKKSSITYLMEQTLSYKTFFFNVVTVTINYVFSPLMNNSLHAVLIRLYQQRRTTVTVATADINHPLTRSKRDFRVKHDGCN